MDQLETGDLVLFHRYPPRCCSIMCLVELCTASDYSHTAVVVKDPQFTSPPLKGLFILESSAFEKEVDIVDNTYKFGVELVPLAERLRNYEDEGIAYYRKVDTKRDKKFYEKLSNAYHESCNATYDINPLDWIEAKLRCFCFNTQQKKTFWCSALVAYVYVCWGFLDINTPWTLVSPKMLGTETPDNYELKFNNCSLEPEFKIL